MLEMAVLQSEPRSDVLQEDVSRGCAVCVVPSPLFARQVCEHHKPTSSVISSQIFGQMAVVSLVKISKSRSSEVPKHGIQDHYTPVLGDITATAPV
jgi:hypothetical protein